MDALMNWHWPGNVRELENFLERSVILTNGTVLAAPNSELVQPLASAEKSDENSLVSIDRRHILKALKDSDGRILQRTACPAGPQAHHPAIQAEKLGIR
jgi:formate hydrogenlyase transcriptional activator